MMTGPSAASASPVEQLDFESVYAEAHRRCDAVPWVLGRSHPALVTWMNAIAPTILRCGARVAVPGCGLGDDVREIAGRGYDVTGFDVSATAIAWARELHASCDAIFDVADILDPPARWRRRFDLVVDVRLMQSLPINRRRDVMGGLAGLMSPHGHLLLIADGREGLVTDADGPPWPLTVDAVTELAHDAGLVSTTAPSLFASDDDAPDALCLRVVLAHR